MMPRDAELGAAKQESSSSGAFERNISSSSSTWSRLKDPRIVRVSRATGGKDRHSKVCTVRGLRDRRVRLSVPTAIQLYDLQDRLGLNQPSKVVDWLLNAAKNEIEELPPLQIPIALLNPHFDNLKDEGTATTERNHHQSWPTTSHHQEDEEGIKHEYQLHNPSSSSSSSYPFINSFGRWEPSNLTLSHTPLISLGLTAQHQHNLPNFSVQSQHQQQQQQQVLVYQSGMMTAQPYFVPQSGMITAFDSKHPTNFHTSEISASSSSLTTATPRPFSFNMATTADLLPSQTNAVDDDLHSS